MGVTLEDIAYRLLPRVQAGRALADSEWRTLARAAETILEGSPVQLTAEQVADNVEQYLCDGRSKRTWRIRVLLTLVEYLPLTQRQAPFSRQAPATRRRFVQQHWLEESGPFALCSRVRLLAIMGSYGDPRAWESIGFVPVAERARFAQSPTRRTRGNATEGMTESSYWRDSQARHDGLTPASALYERGFGARPS